MAPSVVDALLDAGLTPRDFANELGIDLPPSNDKKYDAGQPRNPAGGGIAWLVDQDADGQQSLCA